MTYNTLPFLLAEMQRIDNDIEAIWTKVQGARTRATHDVPAPVAIEEHLTAPTIDGSPE